MENFEKLSERSETKVAESAVTKFWEGLEKQADELRQPTAENKIKDWWNRLTDKMDNSLVKGSGESEKEQDEQPETLEELIARYYEDLKNNSEYPETIEYDDTPWEKITPEENAKMRAEFADNRKDNPHCKENLIKAWEEKHGKEWPRYKEDVYVNGKLIRRAGDRYDAHHIKPLSFGGKNEVTNITPISAEKHFDKQGVHSPTSPYGKIEKSSQGEKPI